MKVVLSNLIPAIFATAYIEPELSQGQRIRTRDKLGRQRRDEISKNVYVSGLWLLGWICLFISLLLKFVLLHAL